MLRQTQPDIPVDGPGGLVEMYFCLFQCEQEGESPPENWRKFLRLRDMIIFADDHVRQHRAPKVRTILADERLENCLGALSLEESEHLSYDELRREAIFLKRQIEKWMGLISPRQPRRRGKNTITPREISTMIRTLDSFLAMRLEDDARPAVLILLCYEVDAILSDERFSWFSWHVQPHSRPYSHLLELAPRARASLKALLRKKGHASPIRNGIMVEQRSAERPILPRADMEKMRDELVKFIKLRLSPKTDEDKTAAEAMQIRIRKILSDSRLKDHYGYVSKQKAGRMDHGRLWQRAVVLEDWLNRWLH